MTTVPVSAEIPVWRDRRFRCIAGFSAPASSFLGPTRRGIVWLAFIITHSYMHFAENVIQSFLNSLSACCFFQSIPAQSMTQRHHCHSPYIVFRNLLASFEGRQRSRSASDG